MIQTSDLVLKSASDEQSDVEEKLGLYVASIKEHMKDQCIAGWVAVRCALGLLYRSPSSQFPVLTEDLMDDLRLSLLVFFRPKKSRRTGAERYLDYVTVSCLSPFAVRATPHLSIYRRLLLRSLIPGKTGSNGRPFNG